MIKKYGAKRQRERRKGGKEEGGGRGRKGKKNIVPGKKIIKSLPDRELNPGLPRDRRKY